MRPTPVIALLFFLIARIALSDPLIARAQQRQKAGDLEASAALLSSWLAANPGASGSAAVFAMYVNAEQDLPALLDASGRFLQSAKGVPGASLQFEKIARLFDLSGRIEEARNAYAAAHAEGAPDWTLVSAFLLSLQMNDSDSMAACLRQLAENPENGHGSAASAVLLLKALSDLRSSDQAGAKETLTDLADQTGNPDLALKALWILYQSAGRTGDAAGAAAARAKLGSRFSTAPETALAAAIFSPGTKPGRALVVQLPIPFPQGTSGEAGNPPAPPAALAAPAAPPASSQVPPAPPPVSAPPRFSVQAGSFLMKENADDLLSELTKRGFSPVVVHEVVLEKERFRVLAGTGMESDVAKALLQRLSEAGFKGFLVAEK